MIPAIIVFYFLGVWLAYRLLRKEERDYAGDDYDWIGVGLNATVSMGSWMILIAKYLSENPLKLPKPPKWL